MPSPVVEIYGADVCPRRGGNIEKSAECTGFVGQGEGESEYMQGLEGILQVPEFGKSILYPGTGIIGTGYFKEYDTGIDPLIELDAVDITLVPGNEGYCGMECAGIIGHFCDAGIFCHGILAKE